MAKWIIFETWIPPTGTITIVDKGSDTTDINQLHGTNGFTITDGYSKAVEYIFDKNNALGATGTVNAEGTVIQVYTFSAATDVASEVVRAINSDGGHPTSITCSRVDNVITLTSTNGTTGNVTIAPGSTPTPSYISYTGMSGGVAEKNIAYPVENINAMFLTDSSTLEIYARNPVQPNEDVSDDLITLNLAPDERGESPSTGKYSSETDDEGNVWHREIIESGYTTVEGVLEKILKATNYYRINKDTFPVIKSIVWTAGS